MKILKHFIAILIFCLAAGAASAAAQTNEFTYQGQLNDTETPMAATYDFEFRLCASETDCAVPLETKLRMDVAVSNGGFSVRLDFAAAHFTGADRFLEIRVRRAIGVPWTTLLPRQKISSAPYSIRSLNATTADNSLQLGGAAANQFVQTTDARLSDARNPLPNSTNYIQNRTTPQQAPSNFNISGDGTLGGRLSASVVNAATQYDFNGIRILSVPPNTSNLFVGYAAGNDHSTGNENSAFGYFAGERTNSGVGNSFFGRFSGRFNTGGSRNSFFGGDAGVNNTTGNDNTFIGGGAGLGNFLGSNNTLIGSGANVASNNLSFATAIGSGATVSSSNTVALGRPNGTDAVQIFGNLSVGGTITGGTFSGTANNALNLGGTAANQYVLTTDPRMTNARTPLPNSADYIQSGATSQAASFNITGFGYIGNQLAVGTTTPNFKAEIVDVSNTGLRVQTNATGGTVASFGGNGTFAIDAPGQFGGRFVVLENGNIGIGTPSPVAKLELSGFGIVRSRVNSDSNAGFALALNNQTKWSLATVTGGQFQVFNETNGQNAVWITPNDNFVGIGTTTPAARLDINGSGMGVPGLKVQVSDPNAAIARFGPQGTFLIDSPTAIGGRFLVTNNGVVEINNPGGAVSNDTKLDVNGYIKTRLSFGGILSMCVDPVGQLGFCSSSIRYKENVKIFASGLELVRRLRPVSFNWKQNGAADFGLIAEEVAEVEPLLATYNTNGEVEGVKYDRIGVVLINVVKEQQTQIERQQQQIDALKRLVCESKPEAAICKEKRK